ncbi:unnamed protein product [Auanema sp. JU1783]|nr:unnamed protein product [Auanema sp. JU1783]
MLIQYFILFLFLAILTDQTMSAAFMNQYYNLRSLGENPSAEYTVSMRSSSTDFQPLPCRWKLCVFFH